VVSSDSFTGVGSGFLTPTPLECNGVIRVFGGARDQNGTSRLVWLDLDPNSLCTVGGAAVPCLDVGAEGHFDQDGVILGDLIRLDHQLVMAYVGFNYFPSVKFAAAPGLAVSEDNGQSFRRITAQGWRVEASGTPALIEAVHSIEKTITGFRVLYSMGEDWELVDGKAFPKYSSFAAAGSSLWNLKTTNKSKLPQHPDVYRLGRPRFVPNEIAHGVVIATGGRASGDYRPYLFLASNNEGFEPHPEGFPIVPGDYSWCSKHVSYPSFVVIDDFAFMFLNGDEMGIGGCYVMKARISG